MHWPTGPFCGQTSPGPAQGLLAPSPALSILGTGCAGAWAVMGNPAQTKDAGARRGSPNSLPASLKSSIQVSWITAVCPGLDSKDHSQWALR